MGSLLELKGAPLGFWASQQFCSLLGLLWLGEEIPKTFGKF